MLQRSVLCKQLISYLLQIVLQKKSVWRNKYIVNRTDALIVNLSRSGLEQIRAVLKQTSIFKESMQKAI